MAGLSSFPLDRRTLLGLGFALGAAPVVPPPGASSGSGACAGGRDTGEQEAFRALTDPAGAEGEPTGPALANVPYWYLSKSFRRHYVSRAGWGADESLRFDARGAEIWPPTYWPVQTFTVHHSADSGGGSDPKARLRSIYRYHTVERGWGDIGYHFAIDRAGIIYEGRYSGGGIPGFDRYGRMANAAHVPGYNAGNVGIVLLGDFRWAVPSLAARQSLVQLLVGLTRWQGIDPRRRVHYVNPITGAARWPLTISGHRDWTATECPGQALHGVLKRVRRKVAQRRSKG